LQREQEATGDAKAGRNKPQEDTREKLRQEKMQVGGGSVRPYGAKPGRGAAGVRRRRRGRAPCGHMAWCLPSQATRTHTTVPRV
jgi:hypothetical protein